MALELVVGAVVGVFFDRSYEEIWRVKDDIEKFEPQLQGIERKFAVMSHLIETEESKRRWNRPNHESETIMLRELLEDATKLVSKGSKISKWNILKLRRVRGELVELDNKISRFFNLDLQAHMVMEQKQTLLFVQEMRQMMMTMSLNQQRFSNLTMGFTDSSDLTPASSSGSSNITVGITASSTGSHLKIVMKVEMSCERCICKALETAGVAGVNSVAIEGDHGDTLVVTGEDVDVVNLATCLRKTFSLVSVLSVKLT